jgi:hypothetical protein
VLPPPNFELQAVVHCASCGEIQGTWRTIERAVAGSNSGTAPASDVRSSKRVRSIIGGKVVFNDRQSVVDCIIRDLSENGAKLVFSGHVQLPDEFDLELPMKERTYRARVMWRKAETCGVQFLDAAEGRSR